MDKNRHRKRHLLRIRLPLGAEWLFTVGLILLDALALNAVFLVIFKWWLRGFPGKEVYLESYFQVRLWLFLLFLGLGAFFDIFRLRSFRAASDVFSHTTGTLLATYLSFNLLVFLSRTLAQLVHTFPRPIILFSVVAATVLLFLIRVILFRIFKPQAILLRAVIVGDEIEGKRILRHFQSRGGVRLRLVGIFPPDKIEALASEVVYNNIHEVIITDPKVHLDAFWAKFYWERKVEPHPFRVRVVFDPSMASGSIGLDSLEDLPLNTIPSLPLTSLQRFTKRTFDILFALFAILLTSPAMILAALLVRLDSPGPIFYKQRRVGRFGREFDMVKFRTMHVGAETKSGPKIATADDPRTTRFGKYLRRFAIDELPQFFLVLAGEMSIVGPRPERPFFVRQHHEFQGRRLSVRPGVTGLAAVNSRYYLRLTDKVGYDYYYLDHYNWILDIKIVFQTIWVLLFESDKALEDVHHSLDKMGSAPSEGDRSSEEEASIVPPVGGASGSAVLPTTKEEVYGNQDHR